MRNTNVYVILIHFFRSLLQSFGGNLMFLTSNSKQPFTIDGLFKCRPSLLIDVMQTMLVQKFTHFSCATCFYVMTELNCHSLCSPHQNELISEALAAFVLSLCQNSPFGGYNLILLCNFNLMKKSICLLYHCAIGPFSHNRIIHIQLEHRRVNV